MSATDELRKMLDKRGVEWKAPLSYDSSNRYDTVAGGYWFHEFNGKLTIHGLTPAQAIAATLGAGTLTAEQVSRATYAHSIHADCADADWQAIADELNATLGAGTCHNVHEPPKDTTFWPAPHFKCSECGATHVSMEYVFYCPNCGRKVVDE